MNDSFSKLVDFIRQKVQLFLLTTDTHNTFVSYDKFLSHESFPKNFLHVNKELKSFYILSITKKEKYATIYFAHVSLTSNSSSCQYYLQKITSC